MKRLLLLALFVSISSIAYFRSDLFLVAQTQAQEKEPIAYIGHGGFFDHDGKQIELAVDFVAKAQDWYRAAKLDGWFVGYAPEAVQKIIAGSIVVAKIDNQHHGGSGASAH